VPYAARGDNLKMINGDFSAGICACHTIFGCVLAPVPLSLLLKSVIVVCRVAIITKPSKKVLNYIILLQRWEAVSIINLVVDAVDFCLSSVTDFCNVQHVFVSW